jgi:hypothetical protein
MYVQLGIEEAALIRLDARGKSNSTGDAKSACCLSRSECDGNLKNYLWYTGSALLTGQPAFAVVACSTTRLVDAGHLP